MKLYSSHRFDWIRKIFCKFATFEKLRIICIGKILCYVLVLFSGDWSLDAILKLSRITFRFPIRSWANGEEIPTWDFFSDYGIVAITILWDILKSHALLQANCIISWLYNSIFVDGIPNQTFLRFFCFHIEEVVFKKINNPFYRFTKFTMFPKVEKPFLEKNVLIYEFA